MSLVAVLGAGSIGLRHAAAAQRLRGLTSVTVPARPERVRALARRGIRTADGLEAAAEAGASMCVVATNTCRHAEDAREAFRLGLDALVEKPLARNAREAMEICRAARAHGRRLSVACVLRFSESLGRFRLWLPRVGRLHSVRIECQSYLPDWRPDQPYQDCYSARSDDGGVLRDLIHEIDYAGWLFGWPRAIQARVANLRRLGIEAEESADLSWRLPSGGVLSMRLDYLSRPARRRIGAFGEWGTLSWDGVLEETTLEVAGRAPRRFRGGESRDEQLAAQLKAFASRRQDPRLASGEDGARALAVCDAARQASSSGREVKVVKT